ncbi:MAG: helix-turn-helix domain-containing protein [Pseudonocardiaceae bacterium]
MREARGWTQHDLADRSGYSQPTISRLERGVSRAVRDTAVLADVAQALGAPLPHWVSPVRWTTLLCSITWSDAIYSVGPRVWP